MNTCTICKTKQSAQTSICRTCGFPLRLPKFLSEVQYESWMLEEVIPLRKQWSNQQKLQEQLEHTAQEIAELKRTIIELQQQNTKLTTSLQELQKQNLKLTATIQELPELKRTVAALQKQLQTPRQPVQSSTPPHNPSSPRSVRSQKPFKEWILTKEDVKNTLRAGQTSYTVPDGVTSIASIAFASCISLQEIYLPYSLTKIGENAFFDCRNLHQIHLSSSLISIEGWAFYNVNATVYYPASCAGKDWVGKNHGGKLVWKPY